MQKADVLIAVAPEPLLRIIEHLFERPDFEIVESLSEWTHLPREANRLQPNVIVANMTLLGYGASKILSDVKFASPASKVILISFPHDVSYHARRWGADAYLKEEQLVQRLIPTVKQLLVRGRAGVSNTSRWVASTRHPAKQKNSRIE